MPTSRSWARAGRLARQVAASRGWTWQELGIELARLGAGRPAQLLRQLREGPAGEAPPEVWRALLAYLVAPQLGHQEQLGELVPVRIVPGMTLPLPPPPPARPRPGRPETPATQAGRAARRGHRARRRRS